MVPNNAQKCTLSLSVLSCWCNNELLTIRKQVLFIKHFFKAKLSFQVSQKLCSFCRGDMSLTNFGYHHTIVSHYHQPRNNPIQVD